jgi:cell growth-regulating nucleolar protein
MVSFVCNVCQETLKKAKLDQHYGRCRGANFSCIDCNTDFNGTAYRSHTSCISEAEKYQKSMYKNNNNNNNSNNKAKNNNNINDKTSVNKSIVVSDKPGKVADVQDANSKTALKSKADLKSVVGKVLKEKNKKNSKNGNGNMSLYKFLKKVSKESSTKRKELLKSVFVNDEMQLSLK